MSQVERTIETLETRITELESELSLCQAHHKESQEKVAFLELRLTVAQANLLALQKRVGEAIVLLSKL